MSKGDFCWYDYMANDVDKAKAFYGEAIGWKTQEWGNEGYQMWMLTDETAIGGVMKLPEEAAKMGAPPHWMSFIATDDVDASANRCKELGGNILAEPWDLPEVGRIAVLQDPHGAVFGVTAFEDEMTPPSGETPGAFSWSELWANDVDTAFDFYSDLFGWKKGHAMEMGDDTGTYQMFDANGATVGGMMKKPDEMPMAAWTFCITTDDLDAATGRIEQNGGSIMNGPMDVPNGRCCYYNDNQGGVFALYEFSS